MFRSPRTTLTVQTLEGRAVPSATMLCADAGRGDDTPAQVRFHSLGNSHLAAPDAAFVRQATAANLGEIVLGSLAAWKGTNPAVKAYGTQLVADHSASLGQLLALGDGAAVRGLHLNPNDRAELRKLLNLSGSTFDGEFASYMVAAHQQAITLYTNEAQNGQDPALKAYAQATLPVLQQHLQEAQQLLQTVGGSVTPSGQSNA